MRRIPFYDLEITGGYWRERQLQMRKTTVWSVYRQFQESGRICTMNCDWQERGGPKPHFFWGSDVFKWIEGTAYLLEQQPDTRLLKAVDEIVQMVERNTTEDGYYNSYFNTTHEKRFSDRDRHELYSLGHMIEAGIALFHATGDQRLLNVCRRNADLVEKLFMKEQSTGFMTPGHEEIELALVKLYHATDEKRYLALAEFFIRMRGNNTKDTQIYLQDQGECTQSHLPVLEQKEAVGHAVRALYLYCGIADLGEALEDVPLQDAAKQLFFDLYRHKMYLTGGVGALQQGERLSAPFHLPNRAAYAETCAALALVLLGGRLAALEPDGAFGDAAERALYNGMISGLSLSGDAFFYENPLAVDLSYKKVPYVHQCDTVRRPDFKCACCPPNLVRLIPSVGDWIYSYNEERLFVHQYIPNRTKNGPVEAELETRYPEDGRVRVRCRGHKLALRKPAWCRALTASAPYREEKGYLYFDVSDVEVSFTMEPFFVRAADAVHADCGRAALQRGPLIYCLEGQDQPGALDRCRVNPNGALTPRAPLIGGFCAIEAEGWLVSPQQELYAPYQEERTPCKLTFIPYYTFANRGEDEMQVWVLTC